MDAAWDAHPNPSSTARGFYGKRAAYHDAQGYRADQMLQRISVNKERKVALKQIDRDERDNKRGRKMLGPEYAAKHKAEADRHYKVERDFTNNEYDLDINSAKKEGKKARTVAQKYKKYRSKGV